MQNQYVEIDVEALRKDLVDYFGSATPMYPIALADVVRVEQATPQELINIAQANNVDLNDYATYTRKYDY